MGLTKTKEFTKSQNDIAAIARALAHPARIAILQFLSRQKSCVCGDIVDELPLAQSTVSQHLKELKNLGLIKGEIEGSAVCYCINKKALSKIKSALGNLFTEVEQNTCC